MTDEQLSALLRLKRYEQPPAQYFDTLLQDIHRRQRAELLRRPLWRIMLERVQTFFSEHSMGHASYAGAMATVLVAGVAAIGVLFPGEIESRNEGSIAQVSNAVANGTRMVSLQPVRTPPTVLEPQSFRSVAELTSANQPRYVIDARPVSYEASFQF
jgi:hypothetical protein